MAKKGMPQERLKNCCALPTELNGIFAQGKESGAARKKREVYVSRALHALLCKIWRCKSIALCYPSAPLRVFCSPKVDTALKWREAFFTLHCRKGAKWGFKTSSIFLRGALGVARKWKYENLFLPRCSSALSHFAKKIDISLSPPKHFHFVRNIGDPSPRHFRFS